MPRTTKPPRISNREMRSYVNRKAEFRNAKDSVYAHELCESCSIDGTVVARRYVVYSYGEHFPMYIHDYETGCWYGNLDRYSVTTSKHQSAARPSDPVRHAAKASMHMLDTDDMIKLACLGFIRWIAAKAGVHIAA